ncbi:MAG: nucleoside-diphosphate kinase [Candidatus Paceibacteria bacterium]|jgi:nucleoside-diphosphate kinase
MKNERTFVMIKPDGIQRSLIGEIVKRIERTGLKLAALKMIVPTEEKARKHYTSNPEWVKNVGIKSIEVYKAKGKEVPTEDPLEAGEIILERLIKYITSGPVVAMVFQGVHAVPIVRKVVGSTEPLTSDVGTIRGDFVIDSYELSDIDNRSVRNLIHASGTVDEASEEIKLWFDKEEVVDYRLVSEQILYDVNLDGILE